MLLIPGVSMRGYGPSHPCVNTGNSFGKRRCSLRGTLVHIQCPDYSRAEQRIFENQKFRRLPAFEQEQPVLKVEQLTHGEGQMYQVCDLCKVEPGNKVTISQEWQKCPVGGKTGGYQDSTPGAVNNFDQVCWCSILPKAETVGLVLQGM